MRSKKMLGALASLCFLGVLCGCAGEKTPPDMPKLQSTIITITQEGKPLEGANVQLVKKDDLNYKWLCGGTTTADGKCVVKTLGKYNGVPEGDFTVLVYKTVVTESETRKNVEQPREPKEAQEWARKVAEEEKSFEYVDPKYKKYDTSDLTITIKAGKNEQTFEVGPQTEIEVKPTLQTI